MPANCNLGHAPLFACYNHLNHHHPCHPHHQHCHHHQQRHLLRGVTSPFCCQPRGEASSLWWRLLGVALISDPCRLLREFQMFLLPVNHRISHLGSLLVYLLPVSDVWRVRPQEIGLFLDSCHLTHHLSRFNLVKLPNLKIFVLVDWDSILFMYFCTQITRICRLELNPIDHQPGPLSWRDPSSLDC